MSVSKNQTPIQCDQCNSWSHASCNGISKSEYESLVQEDESIPWYCLPCQILNWANIFPISFLSRSELHDMNGVDLPSRLTNLLPLEISSRLNNLPNLNDYDLDENLVHSTDSKYRKVSELSSMKTNQTFSLFHVNIRSPTKHLDELGITESKQLVGTKFPVNINIDSCQIYSQPTKSIHGGVVMYVNKKLDHVVREDISVLKDEFETLWIEIKTGATAKNILCCCVYRHLNTDTKKFTEHTDDVLSKLEKSNKKFFLMGDFNVNLLSYEHHTETNDFTNSMVSHYLLPYILHPTRVTDHSSTVIDNIFSNVTEYETISAKIINQTAYHFAVFTSEENKY